MVIKLLSILGIGSLGVLLLGGLPSCSALTPAQPQAPIMPIINNNPASDSSSAVTAILVVVLIFAVVGLVVFMMMWYQTRQAKKDAVKRAESLDLIVHNLTGIPGHHFVSHSGTLSHPQLLALLKPTGELTRGTQEVK